MQTITETFSPRVYEYNNFMKSFKRHYPDFYAKYYTIIERPAGRSTIVSIRSIFKIKPSSAEILRHIIAGYYRPINN